jgi:cation transport regulator ChaB
MSSRHTHQTSVRYLLPSTKRDLDNKAFDNAMEQFYELASQEANSI